jgi:hypothetical protein
MTRTWILRLNAIGRLAFLSLAVSFGGQAIAGPTPSCPAYWSCVARAMQVRGQCLAGITSNMQHVAPGYQPSTISCDNSYNNSVRSCGLEFSCPPAIVHPAFLVLTLLYAPPGNLSSSGFTQGTTQGTTTGISSSFGSGTTVSIDMSGGLFGTGATASASFGVSSSSQSSQGFQISATSTSGSQVKSATDYVDHSEDRFFLWLNPELVVQETGPTTVTSTVRTANGLPMDIIDVNVHELQNPGLIPPWKMAPQVIGGYTLPGLSNLAPADFMTILSLDPLINTNPASPPADTNRFVYIENLPLEGPDYLAVPPLPPMGSNLNVNDSQVQTQGLTESVSFNTSLGVGGKVEFPELFSVSVSQKQQWTWTQTSSIQTSSGIAHAALVTLGSSTVKLGCHIDVYEDTVYNTFAFVTPPACALLPPGAMRMVQPPPFALVGTVTNGNRSPVYNQLVIVSFATGGVQRLYTDHHGQYVVYTAPAGPVQINVGGSIANQTIVPGQTVVANFGPPVAVVPLLGPPVLRPPIP